MKAVNQDIQQKHDAENSSLILLRNYYKMQKVAEEQAVFEGPFNNPEENIKLKRLYSMQKVC